MSGLDLLETTNLSRYAFRFTPADVRINVPPLTTGVYGLLDENGRIVYVGRSDRCVRTRLSHHEHLGKAAYFCWRVSRSPRHAFRFEAWWYHQTKNERKVFNAIHPARPSGSEENCPFCAEDLLALQRALPHTTDLQTGQSQELTINMRSISK